MFHLIRLIIFLVGVATIAYFVLPYFGYEVNLNYWNERKADCQARLEQCQKDLIRSGIEGAKEKCRLNCVEPRLLIKKQSKSEVQRETESQEPKP